MLSAKTSTRDAGMCSPFHSKSALQADGSDLYRFERDKCREWISQTDGFYKRRSAGGA